MICFHGQGEPSCSVAVPGEASAKMEALRLRIGVLGRRGHPRSNFRSTRSDASGDGSEANDERPMTVGSLIFAREWLTGLNTGNPPKTESPIDLPCVFVN